MTRLLVDTSSDYLVILLVKDDNIISSLMLYAGRKMSELLLDQLDNVLSASSISVNEIDEFYAGIGPGSFTGVRIGVALILGLSSGSQKNAFGISSLDVRALASDSKSLKTAALLKGNIYAVRNYDFLKNIFSEYYLEEINDNLDDYLLINNEKTYFPDYVKAIKKGKLWSFKGECLPIYLRKSEAEINIDKKSTN